MKKIIFIFFFISFNALPWGSTGHRVVGEIAEKYLTKSAYKNIQNILKGESLAKAANWPDEIKSEPETYSHTYNWHYTEWPDSHEHHDHEHNGGKLIPAIDENIKVIKNPKASREEKAFAIRFIVHLIGDLHQPLHVGNGLDQGGNACKVVFQGLPSNLHRVWDEDMINFTKLSFTEMTKFILDTTTKLDVNKIQKGTPLDWARESKELRNLVYPSEITPTPDQTFSYKNYCRIESEVPLNLMPLLGYHYSYKFMPIVERRLKEAGLRLAMLLNDCF
jgi:hypothetical protein